MARKQTIMTDHDLKTFVSELDDIASLNTTVIANVMSNSARHNAHPEIPTTAPTLRQNTLCTIGENTTPNQMITQTVSQKLMAVIHKIWHLHRFNRLSIDTSTLPEYSFQGNTTTTQHGTTLQQESVCLNNSRPSKRRRYSTQDSLDSQQVRQTL